MKTFIADMQKGRLMSDLISTQELVSKIVDTAIRKIMSGEQKLTKEYEQSVIEAVDVILNTAQCKNIQCKDCKHSRFFDPCFYCYEFGKEIIVPENGFCFMAERRTDEHID